MTGRPTRYSAKLATDICERLANGESLRRICSDEHMPDKATVIRWLTRGAAGEETYKAFCDQYACARDWQAESYMDEAVDIADGEPAEREHIGSNDDGVSPQDSQARQEFLAATAQRDKLRVDTRIKVAEKLAPKRFGSKGDTNVNVSVNGVQLAEQDKALLDEYAKQGK
ncbi:terminase small subunit-like protein [Tautonia plasticadhaerens]|uniref:Terminase small subunit n=1 Tax=Tautonia plasticadhaerens TaxID=2527974 RepID=A0A518H266_9BACT|nr:hypothetical protein [Tautonia plasticadhaerens]QDV34923.1 hypothetical protein ElP_28200 [Tautonia plasticadhaerens]